MSAFVSRTGTFSVLAGVGATDATTGVTGGFSFTTTTGAGGVASFLKRLPNNVGFSGIVNSLTGAVRGVWGSAGFASVTYTACGGFAGGGGTTGAGGVGFFSATTAG